MISLVRLGTLSVLVLTLLHALEKIPLPRISTIPWFFYAKSSDLLEILSILFLLTPKLPTVSLSLTIVPNLSTDC